jgi:hypothetical protein
VRDTRRDAVDQALFSVTKHASAGEDYRSMQVSKNLSGPEREIRGGAQSSGLCAIIANYQGDAADTASASAPIVRTVTWRVRRRTAPAGAAAAVRQAGIPSRKSRLSSLAG